MNNLEDKIEDILEGHSRWSQIHTSEIITYDKHPYIISDILEIIRLEKKALLEIILDKMDEEENIQFHKNIVKREYLLLEKRFGYLVN